MTIIVLAAKVDKGIVWMKLLETDRKMLEDDHMKKKQDLTVHGPPLFTF